VGGTVAKVHERGQQSINEDQFVLRSGAYCPAPWSRREPSLMLFMPQRSNLGDEFSDHNGRQPRDLSTPDDRRTCPANRGASCRMVRFVRQ
jgi:hypothetical protein